MFIAQHIEIDFFYWVQDFRYITRKSPNEAHSTLSLLSVVTISFTSHNHFVFWTWNVSHQMPTPTIVFNSSHNSPMLEFGRNETLAKSRKSIMRSPEHYWTHRGLLANWESGRVRLSELSFTRRREASSNLHYVDFPRAKLLVDYFRHVWTCWRQQKCKLDKIR